MLGTMKDKCQNEVPTFKREKKLLFAPGSFYVPSPGLVPCMYSRVILTTTVFDDIFRPIWQVRKFVSKHAQVFS